jgi:hypothetical protein
LRTAQIETRLVRPPKPRRSGQFSYDQGRPRWQGETLDVVAASIASSQPRKSRLASAVAAALKPGGRLAVINWHRRPCEETAVLGRPRGPKTEMRMEPGELAATVEPAGLKLVAIVELPPYHYGAIFEKPPTT